MKGLTLKVKFLETPGFLPQLQGWNRRQNEHEPIRRTHDRFPLGRWGFGETRPWCLGRREGCPNRHPHSLHHGATSEDVSWFCCYHWRVFFLSINDLSQKNAFLVRKSLKTVSDLLKTEKATTIFILAGQTRKLHATNDFNNTSV